MVVRVVQWNIGGGKILKDKSSDKYIVDGLESIIEKLRFFNADIIALQEIHSSEFVNQAEVISSSLGFQYYVSDFYAKSHLDKNCKLGQCIISKFPLEKHNFSYFDNPLIRIKKEDGTFESSHNKGISSCVILLEDKEINFATMHLPPFRRYKVEPFSAKTKKIINKVSSFLGRVKGTSIIAGDFNVDLETLQNIVHPYNSLRISYIDVASRPDGRITDYILYKDLINIKNFVDNNAATDHYPIISTFRTSA